MSKRSGKRLRRSRCLAHWSYKAARPSSHAKGSRYCAVPKNEPFGSEPSADSKTSFRQYPTRSGPMFRPTWLWV
ncbi:MAG: hypothetical protein ACJAV2_004787 [Myxococcota bacterium]